MLALLKPSHDRKDAFKTLEKGIKYFLKAPLPGRPDAMVFYNVWAHIYVVEALSAVLMEPKSPI